MLKTNDFFSTDVNDAKMEIYQVAAQDLSSDNTIGAMDLNSNMMMASDPIVVSGCLGTAGTYGSLGTATGCAGTFGSLGSYGCLTSAL